MTPFEIAQKYVYGEHDALTDNQEIIDMTKDIEQAIAKQLLLHNVSQQRELLNAFQEYYQKGDYNDEYPFDENINRFLKAFNCG